MTETYLHGVSICGEGYNYEDHTHLQNTLITSAT